MTLDIIRLFYAYEKMKTTNKINTFICTVYETNSNIGLLRTNFFVNSNEANFFVNSLIC